MLIAKIEPVPFLFFDWVKLLSEDCLGSLPVEGVDLLGANVDQQLRGSRSRSGTLHATTKLPVNAVTRNGLVVYETISRPLDESKMVSSF
jgi:hypothetical protein